MSIICITIYSTNTFSIWLATLLKIDNSMQKSYFQTKMTPLRMSSFGLKTTPLELPQLSSYVPIFNTA